MLTIAVLLFLFKEYNCYLVLPVDSIEGNLLSSRKPRNNGDPPVSIDWRDHNKISPVKDQGSCAACWAFSAVANIESHLKIYLDQEESLSEQFVIDCDDASRGCEDGSIIQTFANIVTILGGVLRNSDYFPYISNKTDCRYERPIGNIMSPPYPVPVVGFRRVHPDEDVMAEFVYKYGPLSAAINSASMAKYRGGIDEPSRWECDPLRLDHAVLIVGYNVYVSKTGNRVPYWIIKNSWGTKWGDNGYYYLVRGRNACGIKNEVSFAYVL